MSAPFDSAAPTYDADFTHTPLARALRDIVWERLAALFPAGARVLELACGTGEDARHLASRGLRVLASDQSEAMLAVAREKCAGLPVEFVQLDVRDWRLEIGDGGVFDGVFSNFGGLIVLPGGHLAFVLMGRWCAWEILWHLAHLDLSTALRRLNREGAMARVGGSAMRVYYPTTAALRRAAEPHFRLTRVRPLGLFLPPSYLEPLARRRFFPFRLLAFLDRRIGYPPWGDHTLYEFRRNSN